MSPEGAKSVLSDDKGEVLSYIADVPKEKDHELPDSEDEESIGDWEGIIHWNLIGTALKAPFVYSLS